MSLELRGARAYEPPTGLVLQGLGPAVKVSGRFHVKTVIIYKLGFNENYYTFTSILLAKIVMCSNFP